MKGFLGFVKEKMKISWIRRVIVFLGIVLAMVIVECTVMNYRVFSNRGTPVEYDLDSASLRVSNVNVLDEKDDQGRPMLSVKGKEWPVFEIDFDEATKVNTVYLDLHFQNELIYRYEAEVSGIYAANGGNYIERSAQMMEAVRDVDYTNYFMPEFNRSVSSVKITLKTVGNFNYYTGLKFSFGGAAINRGMPFHFSFVRMGFGLIIAGSSMLLVCLFLDFKKRKREKALERGEMLPKRKFRWQDLIVYAIPLIGIVIMYAIQGNFAHYFALETISCRLNFCELKT